MRGQILLPLDEGVGDAGLGLGDAIRVGRAAAVAEVALAELLQEGILGRNFDRPVAVIALPLL